MKNNSKNRILLIDDDEMMRIYFRDIFWIHGRSDTHEVVLASSIIEAESFIEDEKTRPNTIFLDEMIPVKKGQNGPEEQIKRSLDFVEKIKNKKSLSDIKIVIYSEHKEKSMEEGFKKLGVDGYLVKGELMPKEIIAFVDKIYGSNN